MIDLRELALAGAACFATFAGLRYYLLRTTEWRTSSSGILENRSVKMRFSKFLPIYRVNPEAWKLSTGEAFATRSGSCYLVYFLGFDVFRFHRFAKQEEKKAKQRREVEEAKELMDMIREDIKRAKREAAAEIIKAKQEMQKPEEPKRCQTCAYFRERRESLMLDNVCVLNCSIVHPTLPACSSYITRSWNIHNGQVTLHKSEEELG